MPFSPPLRRYAAAWVALLGLACAPVPASPDAAPSSPDARAPAPSDGGRADATSPVTDAAIGTDGGNDAGDVDPPVDAAAEDAAVPDECAVTLTPGTTTPRPTWGVPRPALRRTFRDEHTGACVTRVTEASDDAAGANPPAWIRHEYSRRAAYNADSSLAVMLSSNGWWHLYDVPAWTHRGELAVGALSEPTWHPTEPNLLRYVGRDGAGARVMQLDTRSGDARVLADLASELRGVWPAASRGWTKEEGRPSRDGQILTWQVERDDFGILGVAVIDLSRPAGSRVLGTLSTDQRPDHVSTTPSGRFAVVSWLDGTYAYPVDRAAGTVDFRDSARRLLHARSEHSDLAIGAGGEDLFVYYDYIEGEIAMVDVATGARTALLPIYGADHSAFAGHVAGGAFDMPGWAVVSTYGCTIDYGARPCAHGERFGDDRLALVELRAGGRVLSIAHMHNGGDDYWSEPQATVNRDLTRILFAARWESPDVEVSSYEVRLPAGSLTLP
ncbi:MAG: hypothetical protein RLP09_00065 [Sandaracinaceae bacterium]